MGEGGKSPHYQHYFSAVIIELDKAMRDIHSHVVCYLHICKYLQWVLAFPDRSLWHNLDMVLVATARLVASNQEMEAMTV